MAAASRPIGRFIRGVRGRWRRSLRFRVVLATVIGSTVVLGLIVPILLAQISAGVLGAKQRSALAEATAARANAQRLVDAMGTGTALSPARRVDGVVAAVAARGSGAGLFEVLLLSSEPGGLSDTPERGTNLVSESSIPPGMRSVVAADQRQAWAYSLIRYTDGTSVPGLVVGSPLDVRGVGPYELYQLFPLSQEQQTLDLVRNDTAVAGLLLVLGLAALAALVTFTIVTPVNNTARAARKLAGGDLAVRMPVGGEDDLAQLAMSFNEMAVSLQDYIRQLQELSQVQQRFVADVSHELRTPLTTVRMAADVLHDKRESMSAQDARTVELLQRQLDRFEALLADLLETSRADAGAVVLDLADTDLVTLVERVAESLGPLAADRGSPVLVFGPDRLVVRCDARRVERILGNLVANAIEHGEGRPVEVVLSGAAEGRPGERELVSVQVVDHGVGLAPDELDNVFQRFWRADAARSRRTGGTGLGLSIARGDARAHGGDIIASGELGKGATFELLLPVGGPATAVARTAELAGQGRP